MIKPNSNDKKPEETVNNTAQDSKTQPSAEEQKNNTPQSNTAAEENKPVSQQGQNANSEVSVEKTELSATELITGDKDKVKVWLENPVLGSRQLKSAYDLTCSAIEVREDIL